MWREFIDREGNLRHGLPAVLAKYATPHHGPRLDAYAVKNKGFVGIKRARTGLVVAFRPAVLAPKAYASLMPMLYDGGAERVLLQHFVDRHGWQNELFGNPLDAMQRVTDLAKGGVICQTALRRRLLDPEWLPSEHPLRRLSVRWRRLVDNRRLEALVREVEEFTDGRYALFVRSGDTFCFESVGRGLPPWARQAGVCEKGLSLTKHPDRNFWSVCVDTYMEICRRGKPGLEAVDGWITWPGYGALRRRYLRLMLPLSHVDGRTLLLSASLEDPSIDLFTRAAEK